MHTPVLLKEVLHYLALDKGYKAVDGTVNGGGHAWAISEVVGSKGKVLGIDRDKDLINRLRDRVKAEHKKNIEAVEGSFADIEEIAHEHSMNLVDAVLLDLGFSSYHLEESGRGFSFIRNEILDMRYDTSRNPTAHDILMRFSLNELEKIFHEYGEEQFSRQIAKAILEARKRGDILWTKDLVGIIESAVPAWYKHRKTHPATKVFQALRIAVNDELSHIPRGIQGALQILKPGGRLAIISFHSLEDRIVKTTFSLFKKEGLIKNITKKPVVPSREEIRLNPRSRSSKLRIAEKI